MSVLVVLSGPPGVGKTTLARAAAAGGRAAHLRIDTIEAGLRRSALAPPDLMDAGYHAAAALASDLLAAGHVVIVDAVNPCARSRAVWDDVSGWARRLDVAVALDDAAEHRRRVEARRARQAEAPDWAAVVARGTEPWPAPDLRLETGAAGPDALAAALWRAIGA